MEMKLNKKTFPFKKLKFSEICSNNANRKNQEIKYIYRKKTILCGEGGP